MVSILEERIKGNREIKSPIQKENPTTQELSTLCCSLLLHHFRQKSYKTKTKLGILAKKRSSGEQEKKKAAGEKLHPDCHNKCSIAMLDWLSKNKLNQKEKSRRANSLSSDVFFLGSVLSRIETWLKVK